MDFRGFIRELQLNAENLLAERRGGSGPCQQKVDERVVELGEEAEDWVAPRAGRQRVRPVLA
jgi:hypothetical protein